MIDTISLTKTSAFTHELINFIDINLKKMDKNYVDEKNDDYTQLKHVKNYFEKRIKQLNES